MERTIVRVEDDRTGLDIETLKQAILDNLFFIQGKFPEIATKNDWYMALAYTVRDRLLYRWTSTVKTVLKEDVRFVAYLSAEYLLGPHLANNLVNLGIYESVSQAVRELGLIIDELLQQEEEPGLGNGGLGRLAACYLDSLSTLEIPAIGYGIRYEFGIFDQLIKDGWQVEITDRWLHFGNPWEIARPEATKEVKLGGYTQAYVDEQGRYRVNWIPSRVINGVPYDTPIAGYRTNNANTLRLWKAEAPVSFDFQAFNVGDYLGSVHEKMVSENISKVLYPNDEPSQGRRLRLEQQYFFVSCSLQDIIGIHLVEDGRLESLQDLVRIQLNDTHPSIAVAEMMRLLVDEYLLPWDRAWEMTRNMFAYTNHTLLPEALEKWPVSLFGSVLPRHLEIIYEINRCFLGYVRERFPGDEAMVQRLSLIDESGERYVRMAHLACVGSYAINGVADLHTELLKSDVLRDFYCLWPEKFLNVTNGVTPRRWMVLANPSLSALITEKIGDTWVKDLNELRRLEPLADDPQFRAQWRQIKRQMKERLALHIRSQLELEVDPDSLFDVQVKRLHEYKRQHLNVLNIITLYNRLKSGAAAGIAPRTFLFGGKAAPGYFMAKLIIKLINSVAEVVNNDPDIGGRIKVVFLPDFNVSLGQHIYPAADLSEQISTAGKEASGTGNMKFALNGALTIGTLDGANVEMREEVGAENFFLFGLNAQQVYEMKSRAYNPRSFYESDHELRQVLDQVASGVFSRGDRHLFRPLVDRLLSDDPFMLLADYRSYVDCQQEVNRLWQDPAKWDRMSILNVARMGKFSSDRSIREYCRKIWQVEPMPVVLQERSREYCQL
jgi:starch phosphorylase